jgi:hypothetical protein
MLKDAKIKSPIVARAQFPIQYIDFWACLEQFDEGLKVRKVKETLTTRVRLLRCYESSDQWK